MLHSFNPELKIKEMKTETLQANITVNIEKSLIQLNQEKVKINFENQSANGELEFAGYNLGEFRIAVLQHLTYGKENDAQQLIKQATMLAWELGYDLLISSKALTLLLQNGFQKLNSGNNIIYGAELTWNAFKKVNPASITNFINNQN